jgi:hypothetical protein
VILHAVDWLIQSNSCKMSNEFMSFGSEWSMRSFSVSHISSLLKYMGVSFIAGAVAHGAFSEGRSVITAAIGIASYMLGSTLQNREEGRERLTWSTVAGSGALSALGIGFFTGGLQHFPDSPSRSVWVVPAGFLLSSCALALSWHFSSAVGKSQRQKVFMYIMGGLLFVSAGSVSAWYYLRHNGNGGHHDHHHDGAGHDDEEAHGEDHHGEDHHQ